MAEGAVGAEPGDEFLELMDLLLQGFPPGLGWGMAEEDEEEDVEEAEEDGGGGTKADETPPVTEDDGACSVIAGGCGVTPSEDSRQRCRRPRREGEDERKRGGEEFRALPDQIGRAHV